MIEVIFDTPNFIVCYRAKNKQTTQYKCMGTKKDGVCYPRLVIVGSSPFYSFFFKATWFLSKDGGQAFIQRCRAKCKKRNHHEKDLRKIRFQLRIANEKR